MRALGDDEVKESSTSTWTPGSAATSIRSSRCSTEDAASRCRRWRAGTAARAAGATKSRSSCGLPLGENWEWKAIAKTANGGQPALGFYIRNRGSDDPFMPFALNVLTLRGEQISDVVAFVTRSIDADETDYERWPDRDLDPDQLFLKFERFGLPSQLDA